MANHSVDEYQVEKLLRNMPKIMDNRNSEEIYMRVKMKMNRKQKNKKHILIPTLSIIAAAILCVLISPVFFQNNHLESKSMDIANHKNIVSKSGSAPQFKANDKKEAADINLYSQNTIDQINRTAVYKEDLAGNNLFTYGVLTEDAIVVPVSVIAPKNDSDWITQFKAVAEAFSKKLPSLNNYLPLHGDIQYDNDSKKVHVIIEKSTISSIAEQFTLNLNSIVQYTFASQDVKEVDFTDENGKPIDLGEIGEIIPQVINKTPQTAYFLYQSSDGGKYLLPTDESYPNLQSALEEMKTKPDDFHFPVIDQNTDVTVHKDNVDIATVQFAKKINLEKQENSMQMVEAILLTAKNFGYTAIQFKNLEPYRWNGFDFSKPVNVPIAANLESVK